MALVEAFDKRTGEPVPHLVPEHYFDNPKLRGNYVRSQAAATAAVNTATSDPSGSEVVATTEGATPVNKKGK